MIALRVKRIASIVAATLVLLGIPGGLTARGAEPGLYGYGMTATASAVSFLYNQPSFGVPSDPTFELRKVYSLAELDSLPSGHGLGSILWPGQVVGNAPPSLLFDTVLFNPTQFEQVQPIVEKMKTFGSNATEGRSGYPIRSEGFYPQGPDSDEDEVAAGARSAAVSRVDESDGSSTSGGAGIPGIITFGSLSSHSNTKVISGAPCTSAKLQSPCAVASAVAKVTNLDLFGAIDIDNLVATTTSISDGQKAKNFGSLTIAGMTIKDGSGKPQAEIALDKNGLRIRSFDKDGKPQDRFTQDPLGVLSKQVFQKYLQPHGIDLTVGTPKNTLDGPTARRTLSGLTMHIDAGGMKDLLDNKNMPAVIRDTLRNPTSSSLLDPLFGQDTVPSQVCTAGAPDASPQCGVLSPTVAGFVASFFQGDQDMNVVFGSLEVFSAASPPFDDSLILPPVDIPPFTGGVPFAPGTGDLGGVVPPTTPQAGGQALNLTPVAVKGVPFSLIALALALAIFGATRLRLFADRVMAAPVAARCPLEER